VVAAFDLGNEARFTPHDRALLAALLHRVRPEKLCRMLLNALDVCSERAD
jgi:hypothetical protein